MSTHEVVYFDGAGRAELIRICLHIAKADWKDTRFEGKDWPTMKPTTPLGSVPILKIDGVDHVQSTALYRYAAKLAGWYPTDPVQALIVDEVLESLNELMSLAPKSKDEAELLKLRKEYQDTTMVKYAKFFEGFIQKNGGSGVSKEGPSVADLGLLATVQMIESGSWTGIDKDFFDQFPGIKATVEATKTNEQVASYYSK